MTSNVIAAGFKRLFPDICVRQITLVKIKTATTRAPMICGMTPSTPWRKAAPMATCSTTKTRVIRASPRIGGHPLSWIMTGSLRHAGEVASARAATVDSRMGAKNACTRLTMRAAFPAA